MRNKKGDMETNFEVRSFDRNIPVEEYQRMPKHQLYIVLDNLRSAFNVGAIFRLCDTMRVAGLYLCGYTAFPPHDKLLKTSLGTVDFVPWKKFNTTFEAIESLKSEGVTVWAAETTSQSVSYLDIKIPEIVAVVFGNEALGVDEKILNLCDSMIEIPTYGFKNSMNVATACAVIGCRIIENIKKIQ